VVTLALAVVLFLLEDFPKDSLQVSRLQVALHGFGHVPPVPESREKDDVTMVQHREQLPATSKCLAGKLEDGLIAFGLVLLVFVTLVLLFVVVRRSRSRLKNRNTMPMYPVRTFPSNEA
jgi:hypothetical protein